ncbi:MAG: prenyltransferase [Gammaproteobacteria bacterium]|nr:prenyltransferase [Gammaproteobacteria bacterium]
MPEPKPGPGLRAVARSMRLPFLVLTPVCVLLGVALAVRARGTPELGELALVLIGACCAHLSVNLLNEHVDFRSGLDARTVRTPFSGGSGALLDHPTAASTVLRVGILCLCATIAVGLYLVLVQGPALLPIGLLGVFVVLAYSPWLNRDPLLCLLAPGIGFGPVMVIGTSLVLSGDYLADAVLLSLVPFFTCNNLLLLNQLPDLEADRSVGRNHLAIALGVTMALRVYLAFCVAAAAVIVLTSRFADMPCTLLLALLPLSLSLPAALGIRGWLRHDEGLVRALALNVLVAILTPLTLALVLLLEA